ncbi:MAG: hypothetical protein ACXWT1_07895, partial [Methylobacter sp.]
MQIGKSNSGFAVLIACGNRRGKSGKSWRVIPRCHIHSRLNGVFGFQAAVIFGHDGEGVQGAVGIGRRRPKGLMAGVDSVVAGRTPWRRGGRCGANFQAAAADGFDHEGADRAVHIRFIALA